jgi:hypothetical protein
MPKSIPSDSSSCCSEDNGYNSIYEKEPPAYSANKTINNLIPTNLLKSFNNGMMDLSLNNNTNNNKNVNNTHLRPNMITKNVINKSMNANESSQMSSFEVIKKIHYHILAAIIKI